ncbi:KpsF/GutQ family sugar-phosphate isomerase [Sediminitomix flava]|uniref:Arabinose-5-phosphate isomerase n=1 Tax=Sediminitomix flava TaxID=379075 RepID=A0A315ZIB1_SEDFL|nr:KpsF/GutQ family sugar-phosphate isomerase [Sediminitomix flava]PWJ44953.1 arabinose-5-phosphate isomerase [Sediminitomix flava]
MNTNNKTNALEAAKRVFKIEADEVLKLADKLTDDFANATESILACKGKVIVCGMGKSGHIGKKIAATLASTGTPSFFLHPAEAFHGDLGMITSEDIFIGISNSGETEELIQLIPAVKRNGNKFISICGKADSTLVKNSDFFLNISVDKEACPLELAPTSSTTATLAMGDALAVALMEARDFKPENFAMFHPGGSLGRKLLTKVKDVMRSEKLPIVTAETLMEDLILTMTEGKLGMAIVIDDEGKISGIVTDGDLRRAWQKHSALSNTSVNEIMTASPKTIVSDAMLVDAEELMMKYKITSLIVVEEQKPIGVMQLYSI